MATTETSASKVTADTLAAFSDAFNRHDANALMNFMTEDCVFDAAGGSEVYGARFVGRDAVRAAFETVFKTFPDAHWGDGPSLRHRGAWRVRMGVHGDACGRLAHRSGRVRSLRVPRWSDRSQARVPQGTSEAERLTPTRSFTWSKVSSHGSAKVCPQGGTARRNMTRDTTRWSRRDRGTASNTHRPIGSRPPARRRPTMARSRKISTWTWRSSAQAIRDSRRRFVSRASMASRRSCSRPTKPVGAAAAAMADKGRMRRDVCRVPNGSSVGVKTSR